MNIISNYLLNKYDFDKNIYIFKFYFHLEQINFILFPMVIFNNYYVFLHNERKVVSYLYSFLLNFDFHHVYFEIFFKNF
jgi:hypothetical protein